MKKIAIPSDGDQFAQHFGRCPEYNIFEIENDEIKNQKVISNPGHQPGFLPKFLSEKGVDCIICRGMGRKAQDLFDENNIEVILGVSGNFEEKVNSYIKGELEEGENLCSH